MMHQVEVEGSNISLSSKGNKRMFTDQYLSNTKYSPTRLATLLSYIDEKLMYHSMSQKQILNTSQNITFSIFTIVLNN
jgi:hypothetical protein